MNLRVILFTMCSMHPDSIRDHPLRSLFIDFNSYFAAVEQHDDPGLAGRPVIVIPIDSEHTGAIAASYEAKDLGISRGTSVRDARRICPDIAIRVARHDRYVKMHKLLMTEIERHLPIVKIYSIDECACRLDRHERNAETARAKAREIKTALARNIGPSLRCSIGIAPSILLAKLAAELVKPDGLTIIEYRHLPHALEDLPLRAIPGIGEGVAKRLARAGLEDFASLWKLPPKQARAIWGSVVGERFIYALHGHDIPDEGPPQKQMIGHSRVLSPKSQSPEGARVVARALLLKAASRLRLCVLHASHLRLAIRLRPEGWFEQECVFKSTQNSWVLLRQLDSLWVSAMNTFVSLSLDRRIGLVSVSLHGLSGTGPEPDLFTLVDERAVEEKSTDLWKRIDGLNRRYKKQMVTLASQRDLDLNYLGVKIAFSRVPEMAEFDC
ncbi:MAG TPA: type VI secretion protein ImpB [Sphingomicrobium sp.]|nr:type VI secretion protein ImpB [Sphingomicrobium sp.]